nr:MAG TPA: hypothetical protein [Inoviridae sp.]
MQGRIPVNQSIMYRLREQFCDQKACQELISTNSVTQMYHPRSYLSSDFVLDK